LIKKPKDTWKREFKRKLHASLQIALAKDYRDSDCTFDKFAQLAADICNTVRQAKRQDAKKAKKNDFGGNRSGGTGGSGSARTTPAQRSTTSTGAFKRPTPAEAAALAKEGKCFLCKEPGHIMRECPKGPPKVGALDHKPPEYWNRLLDTGYGGSSGGSSTETAGEASEETKN
jgi:hypothetical protein